MNFLLTGGSGFLGRHLARDLLERYGDSRICIFDINKDTSKLPPYMLNGRVDLNLGLDVCSPNDLQRVMGNVDIVFHLAGIISFSRCDKELLERVHVDGTRKVVECALRNRNVRRIVHVSSVAALGYADSKENPVDEGFEYDWKIAERWKKDYMITKRGGDLVVREGIKNGLDCVIARPGLMWGPMGELNSLAYIRAVRDGKMPFCMPGGTNVVDVRDVSRGLIDLAEKGKCREDYLLSGENLSFREITDTIASLIGVQPPKYTLPRTLCDPLAFMLGLVEDLSGRRIPLTADNVHSAKRFRYFNNSKAEIQLGWKPEICFKQTVKDVVEWGKREGYL